MTRWFIKILGGGVVLIFSAGILAGAGFLIFHFVNNPAIKNIALLNAKKEGEETLVRQKHIEDLIREAHERSQNVKGVYMTATVTNDTGRAATKLRNDIIALLETTELNGVVIDIKETNGVFLPESLKDFIAKLHQKNIWVIARLVVFNDTVEAKAHPEMALKRANGKLWFDNRGSAWLDPSHKGAWDYIGSVAKKAADYEFDEIQFDYLRFPSDGDVENIVYLAFNPKVKQKHEVLAEFFRYLNTELKGHKPHVILSADLFGHVAIQQNDLGIGQRMEDLGDAFDYISFMLYPSHYYNGFQIGQDPERNLPALYFPYRAKTAASVVSNHPHEVVHRSLLIAADFLAGKDVLAKATSSPANLVTATTTLEKNPPRAVPRSRAKLRPWLQDFDLKVDTGRGIYYDAKKVRAQIDAAEAAGAAGWLLWNPSNVYTKEALRQE